ncbi:putative ABC transport system permease protein [Nocardioides scoriae]|uniref:Putative ABC transport system permease protein n=1 Tax=Nocardioides scoriae TaxID=642780 RepID=A0A1H1SF93_9ACTN|nr:FtsX-like permease family protein [Nocardioides scoriae]SDS46750.1 putative ABC transport system permease protein [Nocardioides scoriae]
MLHAAWRSLLGRKLRLLTSTFAIVLGVAFVAGTLIFTDTLDRSFTSIFDSSVGDVVVQPTGAQQSGAERTTLTVPAALVDRLAEVPGAARADGQASGSGVFVIGKNGRVVGGQGSPGLWRNATGALAAGGVQPLQVVRGEDPQGQDEVALDAGTARRAGYGLGEKIRLVNVGRRAVLTPRLVGIADFPDGGSLNGASVAIFSTPAAQELFLQGRDVYNSVWVTAADGVSQEELRDRVARVLPRGFEATTGTKAAAESASDLLQAISFLTVFLLVFAGISLVVGSFLIVNTFSMLVAQRSRELALLRALGASRGQVTRSVLFEALVVGLAGSAVGLGVGVLLALGIRALFGRFGLDLSAQSLVIAWRTPVAAVAVGVLVTVVAAYLPARRSARIPPVAALRDDVAMPESALRRRFVVGTLMVLAGVAAGATGLFADVPRPGYWVGFGALLAMLGVATASPVIALPFLGAVAAAYRRVFGTTGRLAGQNALRNPRRTAATASALMIGLTLVTTMSIAGTSAKASVDQTVARTFVGDIVVSNAIGQAFSPEIAQRVERQPGVGSVTRLRSAETRVDGERAFLTAADPATLPDVLRLDLVAGSLADLRGESVVLSQDKAQELGVGVGDSIVLRFPEGRTRLRVVGIHDAAFASYLTTLGVLERGGYPVEDSALLVSLAPGADGGRVSDEIEKATADLPILTVKDQTEYAAEQRAPIDRLVLMIYALLGLALVIAVLGVVNTLGLSVIERTREIGLLRAIGMDRRRLRRMIGLESVAIAVLGAVLGLAMGLVFGIALMASLRDEGLEVTRVPWGSLGLYLVAAVVIGLVAAVLPARRAARLDVLRAIEHE